MDDVDRIIEAWGREAPRLDVRPLRVLSRVLRLARHLDFARKEAFATHELDTWEFDVLASLRREGPPYELSPGQLIQRTLSTSGTMTNRIDRLVARGLVERRPDPNDRRGVRVRLAKDGISLVEAALADLLIAEERILSVVDESDCDAVADILRQLLLPFETGADQPQ